MPHEAYERRKARTAARDRQESADGRDIGKLPRINNRKRRERGRLDLRFFLETYHAETFPLAWSEDHLRAIKQIETTALEGGLMALAMPRGSGKTSLLIRAGEWTLLYGHRRFIALIAADEDAAEELLDTIRIELETNDLLGKDFPEVCYPIRALEGVTQRAKAQTYKGELTRIQWKGKTIALPVIEGSAASGGLVRVTGILGRIRGMNVVTTTGETLRPDFFLMDDPQTDASARSDTQCATRERVANGAILGLAGPGKQIAGFCSATVIRQGDWADRLLNRKLYPRWHGQRAKLVYDWPDPSANKLWDKYLEVRAEEIAAGEDKHPEATELYRKSRRQMDKGARVGWPARHYPHEISALQHAVNLRADNPTAFAAEYQNEPQDELEAAGDFRVLTSDEFCLRVGETRRREVPQWAEWITCGIDVQQSSLWYAVAAVGTDFTGRIIDRGVWPEQGLEYFTLGEVDRTIHKATERSSHAGALLESLRRLTEELCGVRWTRDDGAEMRVCGGLVDAGDETETIRRFTRETDWPLMPAFGRGVTAAQKPWPLLKKQRGERRGFGWRMPPPKGVRIRRHVLFDTNTWKTKLHRLFAVDADEPTAWTLFRAPAGRHRMLADHLSAEYPTATEGQGRRLYEWKVRPGRDNHWLDAALMAAVAASIQGAQVPGAVREEAQARRRRRVSLSGRQTIEAPESKAGDKEPERKLSLAERRAAAKRRRSGG